MIKWLSMYALEHGKSCSLKVFSGLPQKYLLYFKMDAKIGICIKTLNIMHINYFGIYSV